MLCDEDQHMYFDMSHPIVLGAWGSVMVKALRYYSGGPGFDSGCCHWGFFSVAAG